MAYTEVRNFVYRVIDIFPGPLKTPARWVADRVYGVWDEIFQLLVIFLPAWTYFYGGINALVVGVRWLAEEAATTLRWFVVEFVPRWASWALNTATNVLNAAINTLRSWTETALRWLEDRLRAALNLLDQYAHDVFSWAIDRVREVWDTLSVIRDRVVALLTSPETLVDWLFSALWRRFWRYLDDHAEAIATYVWARREPFLNTLLARLEAFLVRLL